MPTTAVTLPHNFYLIILIIYCCISTLLDKINTSIYANLLYFTLLYFTFLYFTLLFFIFLYSTLLYFTLPFFLTLLIVGRIHGWTAACLAGHAWHQKIWDCFHNSTNLSWRVMHFFAFILGLTTKINFSFVPWSTTATFLDRFG